MARRADPQRIYEAKRRGTLERLVSAGVPRERAEAAPDAYEGRVGRPDGNLEWDAAFREISGPPSPSV